MPLPALARVRVDGRLLMQAALVEAVHLLDVVRVVQTACDGLAGPKNRLVVVDYSASLTADNPHNASFKASRSVADGGQV